MHTPTLQDHFPGAKSPLNYEDSCVRYHLNSSITKKTSKKGFCAFPLPILQMAAGVVKDTVSC